MNSEQIVGYILLSLGILVIVFAAIQIVMVFTGKATPIPLFKSKPQVTQSIVNQKPTRSPTDPQELINGLQNNPLSLLNGGGGSSTLPMPQIIDSQALNNILNLAAYYFIMQFLLGVGFKIANLGVQLVRPIKIEVKNNQVAHLLEKRDPS